MVSKEISTSRIEDFPGVVILADKDGVITEEQLNDLVSEYFMDEGAFGLSFTDWLEKKKNVI